MPKVSVILTTYNRPEFLKQAVNSVFEQTLKDWQLVIIDDASTDPTVSKILKEAEEDPRVICFRNAENINNLSKLWNSGLDFARGEYICFLDDDNMKKPEFCRVLSKYLDEHQELDVVVCISDFIGANGDRRPFPRLLPAGMNKETILKNNYADSGEILVRRNTFDRVGFFDERMNTSEDWDFMIRLLHESKGVGIMEKPLTWYRSHPGQRLCSELKKYFQKNDELAKSKERNKKLSIYVIRPDGYRLTLSQKQVCKGITDSLLKIPFVSEVGIAEVSSFQFKEKQRADLFLVLAPFQIDIEFFELLASFKIPIMTFHLEDPQAIPAVESKLKFVDWVVANDKAAMDYYLGQNYSRVLCCPSLSISEDLLKMKNPAREEREIDVTFCGVAYPSRKLFMEQFLSTEINFRFLLIGEGWEEFSSRNVKILSILDEVKTMDLYRKSRITFCLHRNEEDLGGFPKVHPRSIHRGYIEAFSGALVMIDDQRDQHSFYEDEVVFYFDSDDLREKIGYYLARPAERLKIAEKARKHAEKDFAFRTRFTRILNCFRSPRFKMVVP